MKRLRPWKYAAVKTAVTAACLGLLLPVLPAPAAQAGKEGVFINGSTYFTLEDALLSSGSESGTLQFVVRLNNGGDQPVDFNAYGIQVGDASGHRFAARLTEQQSARVKAGENRDFRFTAQVPPGETAEELTVNIVGWDYGSQALSRDIGGLHVGAVAGMQEEAGRRTTMSLNEVDATLPSNATVTLTAGRSLLVSDSGTRYLYADFDVRNIGASNYKLPSGLKLRFKDAAGELYTATAEGTDQTLLPRQDRKLVLKTEIPLTTAGGDYTLEAYYTKDTQDVVIGSLPLGGITPTVKIGEAAPYSLTTNSGLSLTTDKAVISTQDDGLHVQTTVTVTNNGDKVEPLPQLSAMYQFGRDGSTVSSSDLAAHDSYISPKGSTTYYFYGVLPEGIDTNTLTIALWDNPSAATSSGSGKTTSGTGSTGGSAASGGTGSSASGSSAGSGGASAGSGSSSTGTSSSSGSSAGSSGAGSSNGSSAGSSGAGSSNASSSSSAGITAAPVIVASLAEAQTVDAAGMQAVDARDYQMGTPFALQADGVLDKNLQITMMEYTMNTNNDYGYKTIIAKYKLTNGGTSALTLPEFQTELLSPNGFTYGGTRQTTTTTDILPNASAVISYSYMLPEWEDGAQLSMRFYDAKSTSTYKRSLGTYKVSLQSAPEFTSAFDPTKEILKVYPFQMQIEDYMVNSSFNKSDFSYSYTIKMHIDVKRTDQVVVDQSFSKLVFAAVDSRGRELGTQEFSFTGENKLASGLQYVNFSSVKTDEYDPGLTFNIYEVVTTPSGEVKRLVNKLPIKG